MSKKDEQIRALFVLADAVDRWWVGSLSDQGLKDAHSQFLLDLEECFGGEDENEG